MTKIREWTEMQQPKKLLAICLLLTLATSLFMSLSPVQAQESMTTYAFIDAIPNPVGVGEEVLLRYGVLQQLGYPQDSWTGLSVKFRQPKNRLYRRISCRVHTSRSWYI
jgi:hypothetical protein